MELKNQNPKPKKGFNFVFCTFFFFYLSFGTDNRTVGRQEAEVKCKKIQNKSQEDGHSIKVYIFTTPR